MFGTINTAGRSKVEICPAQQQAHVLRWTVRRRNKQMTDLDQPGHVDAWGGVRPKSAAKDPRNGGRGWGGGGVFAEQASQTGAHGSAANHRQLSAPKRHEFTRTRENDYCH